MYVLRFVYFKNKKFIYYTGYFNNSGTFLLNMVIFNNKKKIIKKFKFLNKKK